MLCGSLSPHGMARHRIADRENGFKLRSVAANVLNKHSRKAKWWSSSVGVGGGGLPTSRHKIVTKFYWWPQGVNWDDL